MRLNKKEISFKVLRLLMALSFLGATTGLDLIGARLAYSEPLNLPAINQFVPLSDTYSFPVLKGLRFDPANPLTLEFIVDTADQKDVSQEEASSLIKYFLAALTIPEEEIWVNLSPYEQDRVIPENLGQTDLGKGLLSQDYVLKQLTSSLTYPESDTGKDYWERTYAEVLKIVKTTNLPVSTFNKIWIVPDKAQVYENENIAVISEASLKAMLEEDYLALQNKVADIRKEKKNLDNETIEKINKAASEVMKEAILPQINRDINSGKNFAALRQIYHSLILGIWFKKKFQDSLYAHYINKGMIKGIDLEDKAVKDKIYNHYVEAFKSGLYNYVKTDYDPGLKKNLKRRYYSGGFSLLGDGSGESLSWFQPEKKSPSYIASMLRIGTGGPAQSLVVKLEGSNAPEVVDEQGEVIASAASPITKEEAGKEKLFRNAEQKKRKNIIVADFSRIVRIDSEVNLRSFMKSILSETKKILDAERSLFGTVKDINVVIAVPLLYIKAAQNVLRNTAGIPAGLVQVAAQDISASIYSGAVSWGQLNSLGLKYVIVRQPNLSGVDNSSAYGIVEQALEYDINPIIVVGERHDQAYKTAKVVVRQIRESLGMDHALGHGLAFHSLDKIKNIIVVYQGPDYVDSDTVNSVQRDIRRLIFEEYGEDVAGEMRILHGEPSSPWGASRSYMEYRHLERPNVDGMFFDNSNVFHIPGTFRNVVRKLSNINPSGPLAAGGAEAQAEKPSSAASPISAREKSKEKTFKDAVKQRRKTVFVVSSSDSDVETMEEFIGDLLRRIEEDPLLRNSATRAEAIAAFPYSDNLQLFKEVSDRLKISGVSSELARLAVHYAPGIEKTEDAGEFFRKLKDSGLEYIIFDSRGQPANDKSLNSALLKAIENELKPIIVVGERGEKDENPYATVVVANQLKVITQGVSAEAIKDTVIAYQPLGLKSFDAGQIVLTHIREIIFQLYGNDAASKVRILYGAENDISSVVNRKSDIDGVFSIRTSSMHGLYSDYLFREFLRRRFEGGSSSPLAEGGAEAQEEKPSTSDASPVRDGDAGVEGPFRRAGKSRRTPIIAARLLGVKITVKGAVQLIDEMLNQRIGGGKLALKELSPDNLELVVFADRYFSFAHLQAIRDALKASGIPSGLVSLAAQDMPDSGSRHLDNIKASGAEYVIIDGSEYKAQERIRKVFGAGMKPIIIVGETRTERFNNTAQPAVVNQMHKILLSNISKDRLKDIVIAYHPPVPILSVEAAWMQLSIRELIRRKFGNEIAGAIRILFSGDVSMTDPGLKNLLKADGMLTDNRITPAGGAHIVNVAEKFLEDRKSGSSSPLTAGGAEAQVEKPAVSAASPIGTDREGEERSFENAVKQKREIVIVENWGMDALSEERARRFIYNIIHDITTSPHFNKLDPRNIDIILPVAPSFVHLRAVADEINSAILNYSIPKGLVRLAAQDVSAYEKGRTGEVSAVQLKELGVEYVIVNAHNELANDKVHLALKYSIKPIIAVGETKKQREDRDIVTQIISEQLSNSIAGVPRKTIKDMVIVYQPSESIIPEQAENVQEYIRMLIFQWYGYEAASKIRILYGGGKGYEMGRVDLMPNIDGVFINDAVWMSRGFSVSRKGVDFLLSKRLREGKSGFVSSSPLDSGVKPQANNIASQWRKGGIDMQGIDVGADAGSSAPLFDSGFDLRNFFGFTFKIVAINEIDDFDSLVSQPRKQEKKLTSIGSPSA